MMIVFQEVDSSHLTNALDEFARREVSSKDEVSAIVWYAENMFKSLVYTQESNRMYSKVKKFIANSISGARLLYFIKLRHGLHRNNPGFGENLMLKSSNNDDQPWFEEPRCYFRRRRNTEHRPHFNLSTYHVGGS